VFVSDYEVKTPDDDHSDSPEEHAEERSGTPRECVRLIPTLRVTVNPDRDTQSNEEQYGGDSKDNEEFNADRATCLKCNRHDYALRGGTNKNERGFRGHKSAIFGRETSEAGSSAMSTS